MAERSAWLREAMAGTWADLGRGYAPWRDALVGTVAALDVDTVVVSHFVAINAAIGAAAGDDRVMRRPLDNCSVARPSWTSSAADSVARRAGAPRRG